MEVTVKIAEYFDERWYKIVLLNGSESTRWISSVTTKLEIEDKPFLSRWRGDIGNREADLRVFEAGQRGKRIHYAWKAFCTGGAVVYNPWERPNYTAEEIATITAEKNGNVEIIKYQDEMLALLKLQKVVEILKPTMLFSERVVYDLERNDAGTIDNVWFIPEGDYPINGKKPLHIPAGIYVVDLKSGKGVDDSAFCQTAAYAKCAESMGDAPYAGTLILHTSAATKTGIPGLACLLRTRPQMEEDYKTYRIIAELWERKNEDAAPRVFEFPSLLTMQNQGENNAKRNDTDTQDPGLSGPHAGYVH